MNVIRKSLAAVLLYAGCCLANAHDFTATVNGQKLFFNIKSEADKTAEVTYNGSIADRKYSEATGNLDIPARIKHNNTVYTVVSVGAKAFSNAVKLEGVSLPSTIRSVEDFAFEGCTSLSRIIFPGSEVTFGQGVFFKCSSIADITFGSDWKTVDLSRFRWSDSLQTIAIPAKVEKIQGMKTLKRLKSVSVDVNNARFSVSDGVLYNRDGKILYGCPRAYAGKLRVKDGTEKISANALIDCPGITELDFPASLQSVSFRETSRMKHLQKIAFRGETPVSTAYVGGEGKFLLQVANPDVKIMVPGNARKAYLSALAEEEGEYAETSGTGSTPFMVSAARMPKAANIIGVKNFTK